MEPGMSTLASHYDVLIIGGGINGVGIAYDAASRCAKGPLGEQHHFFFRTSSTRLKSAAWLKGMFASFMAPSFNAVSITFLIP